MGIVIKAIITTLDNLPNLKETLIVLNSDELINEIIVVNNGSVDGTKEWFLNGKEDVRSCQYLEDVATEFDIQGLELDWVGLCWDADFRYIYDAECKGQWSYNKFTGTTWKKVNSVSRQRYLANAYRVLLTRARQGMVIYIPRGDEKDQTRVKDFYDGVFNYLKSCGLECG